VPVRERPQVEALLWCGVSDSLADSVEVGVRVMLTSTLRTALAELAAQAEAEGRPVSDAPAVLAAWLRREAETLIPPPA